MLLTFSRWPSLRLVDGLDFKNVANYLEMTVVRKSDHSSHVV